jgi:uncharacterized protein with PQ loop repeat
MNIHDFGVHWLGTIGTALVIIAYIPQIRHLLVARCGAGVSLGAYVIWCSASTLLCVYAIIADEPIFVLLQGYHAVACALILGLSVKYKGSRCPLHPQEGSVYDRQPS